ncbi:MAG: DUF418 domain-containing protein [Pedobacter sp.]|nr:MAG: DUF418 domain-containing protein [Pedobacter sp.]
MQKSLDQPIQQNQRTLIVDILRGWALLGVVLMNYFDFFTLGRNWQTFKPDVFTKILMYSTSIIFSAKSWTLLSLLFGYGFAVLMNNVKEKGHNAYSFFAGRMFWLLVLAFINSALFFGDILKDYAILGLILLLFYRSSAKTAFITSLVLLIFIPAISAYIGSLPNYSQKEFVKLFPLYQSSHLLDVLWFGLKGTYFSEMISKPYLYTVHVVMFCCFLWGFSLYKINFFTNLQNNLNYIKRTFWIAFIVSMVFILLPELTKHLKLNVNKYYNFNFLAVLSSMLFFAATICWLHASGKLKAFFANLAVMGKMTLTNYMTQNLIGLLVFSGFGLGIWNTRPLWFYLLLALMVYIVQIYFSKWWLLKYNYGPVEWVWRQLSYRKRLPLKKTI